MPIDRPNVGRFGRSIGIEEGLGKATEVSEANGAVGRLEGLPDPLGPPLELGRATFLASLAISIAPSRRGMPKHALERIVEAPSRQVDAVFLRDPCVDPADGLGEVDQGSRRIEAESWPRHADGRDPGECAAATKLAGKSRFVSGP